MKRKRGEAGGPVGSRSGGGNAAACLVFGEGEGYVLGACVLAASIARTNPLLDRVALVTPDVAPAGRAALREVFSTVLEVPYEICEPIQREWTRFKDKGMYTWLPRVFTKIHALRLGDYRRVLLFDADVLVVGGLAEAFAVEAPGGICSLKGWNHNERHAGLLLLNVTPIFLNLGLRGPLPGCSNTELYK